MWQHRPTTCLIVKKPGHTSAGTFAVILKKYLKENGVDTYVDYTTAKELPDIPSTLDLPVREKVPNTCPEMDGPYSGWQDAVDFCIVIGGDGTLLHAASLFGDNPPPIVTFRAGSLSFLLSFEPKYYKKVLTDVLEGRLNVVHRRRLQYQFHEVRELTYMHEARTS